MSFKYDCSGWATRNDIKCSDGRTIRRNAFRHNDGQEVPLVWNHQHNNPLEVLGHALLENRKEGVYAYCSFNNTEHGQVAKELVKNGDIKNLSIYANQLKQQGGDVLHGSIREVSLVLAGANPGAFIDSIITHADGSDEEAIIYNGFDIELKHGDVEKEEDKVYENDVERVFDELTDEQREVVEAVIEQALAYNEDEIDEDDYEDEYDYEEDYDDEDEYEYDDEYEVDEDDYEDYDEEEYEDSEGGNDYMKQNVFDRDEVYGEDFISHSEMEAIINDAKLYGSMKESALAHGIDKIEYLFPEYKSLNTPPEFIQREMGWVKEVMNGVHHTPFSRIKSMQADITADEARAKGYMKGNLKKEEVFTLLKRTTDPQTVYKKQKLHRDDMLDITDFDVVAWLKAEMRVMLDEELARAVLVGDGRLADSEDKIQENHIRPIWKDEDLYTIKATMSVDASATPDERSKDFIRTTVKSRKNYKGSGSPILFTTEDILTDCLLMEDKNGRVIYDSEAKLATALRVRKIVTVPVMEGLKREDKEGKELNLMGLIVNLNDYNIGADKGGAVNMFDDFDIDYNAQKYLIETRCSGAMIKPFGAIAVEMPTTK